MKNQLKKVEDLIKAEVNVKEIEYIGADNQFIQKKIKPNFVALGKKMGPKMKLVTSALAAYSQEEIRALETKGSALLALDNEEVEISNQ
jgi:isoleucyl-tRNA synthetase